MRLHSPRIIKFCGSIASRLLWTLFRTVRVEIDSPDELHPLKPNREERFLYPMWHDSAVLASFCGDFPHMVALASNHIDGLFVASIMNFLKVGTVLGSTGKGGVKATRQLLNAAKSNDIVIAPDGPRGPRRKMSRGIVYLASRTGRAIVPTAFACDREWHIRGNWTELKIPKPFALMVAVVGEAVTIPAELSVSEIDSYVALLQSRMDQLDVRVAEMLESTQSTKSRAAPAHVVSPRA